MKNKISYIVLLTCMAVLTKCNNYQQEPTQAMPEEGTTAKSAKERAWDFPVKPGTEAWKQAKSWRDNVDACQIPENVLYSLTTEDLAGICSEYPFLPFFNAFNDWRVGIDMQFEDFNGLRELFQREDVSQALVKLYQEKIQGLPASLKEDEASVYFATLDILLSCYRSPDEANQENYREILRQLVTGYEKKITYPEFGGFLYNTNYFARARIIEKMSPKSVISRVPRGENNFVFFNCVNDMKTCDVINELSYQLIK